VSALEISFVALKRWVLKNPQRRDFQEHGQGLFKSQLFSLLFSLGFLRNSSPDDPKRREGKVLPPCLSLSSESWELTFTWVLTRTIFYRKIPCEGEVPVDSGRRRDTWRVPGVYYLTGVVRVNLFYMKSRGLTLTRLRRHTCQGEPQVLTTDCPALKAGEQISSKKKPFNPFRHFLLSPTADAGRKRLGLRVEMSMKD